MADWLAGAAASKRLNVVSTHLVSSHTGEGEAAGQMEVGEAGCGRGHARL